MSDFFLINSMKSSLLKCYSCRQSKLMLHWIIRQMNWELPASQSPCTADNHWAVTCMDPSQLDAQSGTGLLPAPAWLSSEFSHICFASRLTPTLKELRLSSATQIKYGTKLRLKYLGRIWSCAFPDKHGQVWPHSPNNNFFFQLLKSLIYKKSSNFPV